MTEFITPDLLDIDSNDKYLSSGRLSKPLTRMSSIARNAIAVNQYEKVEINSSYRNNLGVQVYVLNVYIKCYITGIPRLSTSSTTDSINISKRDDDLYVSRENFRIFQITHRFSEFRTLRRDLVKQVQRYRNETEHMQHMKSCKYCRQIEWLGVCPPTPSRTLIDGLADYLTLLKPARIRKRQQRLTSFMNEVLAYTKDASYQNGEQPCDAYLNVSRILNEFFREPNQGTSHIVW